MASKVVEIVFVMDRSGSMAPCFEGLAAHLDSVVRPLQGFNFEVRMGFVGCQVLKDPDDGGGVYVMHTLGGHGFDPIYQQGGVGGALFTTDGAAFSGALRDLASGLQGDENHLVALDCALDFPFSPLGTTRRVVALFSDERIEDGSVTPNNLLQVDALVNKIMARRILFFGALPMSPALEQLASADGCQVESVAGGAGLAQVDFGKLLGQMAKSISGTSLQGLEGAYTKALFGQDCWGTTDNYSAEGLR